MTVEILYHDYFIFGDESNVDYLKRCLPDSKFIETSINDKPYFADNEPDLIYMGAMSENNQQRVLDVLKNYKDRLVELIDKGVHMLFTCNSLDILGTYIKDGDSKIETLGIFDFHVVRKMMNRFVGFVSGQFSDTYIVGYKSQFGLAYPDTCDEKFFDVDRGTGLNKECKFEGVKRNNLYSTYIIGPFLIINPEFTKKFLSEIEGHEVKLPFEEVAMESYKKRVADFKDPDKKFE